MSGQKGGRTPSPPIHSNNIITVSAGAYKYSTSSWWMIWPLAFGRGGEHALQHRSGQISEIRSMHNFEQKIGPWNVSIVSCYIILAVRAGDAIAR